MALLDTIPGVEDFIRERIEQGVTHKVVSDELKAFVSSGFERIE